MLEAAIKVARPSRPPGRLEADSAFLASLVQSSTDAIIGDDLQGMIGRWNAGAERLFGYAAGEAIGMPITALIPTDLRREAAEILARVRRGGGLEVFQTVRLAKNGRRIDVSVTIAPVRDRAGGVIGASQIVRDMTERKRADERQLRAAQQLQTIFDAAGESILIVDAEDGLCRHANPASAAIFGYAVEDLVGHGIEVVVADDPLYSADRAMELLLKASDSGGKIGVDWLFKAKDGRPIWGEVELRTAVINDRPSFLIVIRDVTGQRGIEQALRQSQKMEAIGQLTGGIAHDFNNLLAVIHGNLELIREKVRGDADLEDMTGDALSAADRGASLVHQLLAYARKQPLAPLVFRIEPVMAAIAAIAHRTLGGAIDVRSIIPPDLSLVRADPHQLENALLNLAVNARDAMPEGGKLVFEVANTEFDETYRLRRSDIQPGRYVRISVTDTGVGIPEANLDRVFEPFFTTKAAGAGTGLGLSMVYGFLKQSGGHLNLYSEVGVGTTVTLYLPAADSFEAMGQPSAAETAPAIGRGEVILVLEDDPMVRKFALRVLGGLGYATLEAADGAAALKILRDDARVDLLLTDVVLPNRMNGPTVAERALVLRPGLKVLFMTGYAPEAAAQNGLLHPGAQMLSKPFLKSELAAKVRDILGA
jgi:PAS domain S-box-containing protein